MLKGNQKIRVLGARINEYFAATSPWNRSLWPVGSCLSAAEFVECVTAADEGILSDEVVNRFAHQLSNQVGKDIGIGDAVRRQAWQDHLKTKPHKRDGASTHALKDLLERTSTRYLFRWSEALLAAAESEQCDVEWAARAIASHLLDAGFSQRFLHEWWSHMVSRHSPEVTICELLEASNELVQRPLTEFGVLLCFSAARKGTGAGVAEWLDGGATSQWLQSRNHSVDGLRLAGSLKIKVTARDPYACVAKAKVTLNHLLARASLGSDAQLTPIPKVWIDQCPQPFALSNETRHAKIESITRREKLFELSRTSSLDDALELVQEMDKGNPGPAVASGWAAIESLMIGRGEGVPRAIAAERLASIVACSFPRAELTTLGFRHRPRTADALSNALEKCTTNRSRSEAVAQWLREGNELALRALEDRAAEARMRALIESPRAVLKRIRQYVADPLARLYRQRNLVMHGAQLNGAAIDATLRTAARLSAAGLDRVYHAAFAEGIQPLELAARAANSLALVGSNEGPLVTELLEQRWNCQPNAR